MTLSKRITESYSTTMRRASVAAFLGQDPYAMFQAAVSVAQFVSVSVSIVLLGIIIYFVDKKDILGDIRKKISLYLPSPSEKRAERLERTWKNLQDELALATKPADYRRVLEGAEQILFFALDEHGIEGETLDDKLYRVTPAEIRNLADVFAAHRTLIRIEAHPSEPISAELVESLLAVYERAVRDVGVLVPEK